jgi:hypothetical protein
MLQHQWYGHLLFEISYFSNNPVKILLYQTQRDSLPVSQQTDLDFIQFVLE